MLRVLVLLTATGGGVLSELLAKSFSHVYVSDPGTSNLALARSVLRPASRFTFRQATGEDQWLPPSSVDMVAAGESFHWMDTNSALAAAAACLKPGGTFAAIHYSLVLHFPDDARLAPLMQRTEMEAFSKFFARDARFRTPAIMAAPPRCQRGWNVLELPEEEGGGAWRDWTRVGINIHGRSDEDAFNPVPEEQFPLPPSRVKAGEKVVEIDDPAWGQVMDIPFIKDFLVSLTLPYDDRCWALESWVEFERIINEEFGGRIRAEWPVSVLLGSKK